MPEGLLLLPEPMPEPLPPLLPPPEPGCFVVLLPLPDAPPEVLPLAPEVPPAAAPEPDLSKYASHSFLSTVPLLSLSTDEKLGVLLAPALLAPLPLAPLLAPLLPEPLALGVDEAPLLLEPLALGVDEAPLLLLGLEGAPLDALLPEDPPDALLPEDLVSAAPALEPLVPDVPDELELCATATLASAKSAAAVAVPTTFNNMDEFLLGELGKLRRE